MFVFTFIELLLNFVLVGLNSVEHGVAQILWTFATSFCPYWLFLPADLLSLKEPCSNEFI
jgi:hypothetical protein